MGARLYHLVGLSVPNGCPPVSPSWSVSTKWVPACITLLVCRTVNYPCETGPQTPDYVLQSAPPPVQGSVDTALAPVQGSVDTVLAQNESRL